MVIGENWAISARQLSCFSRGVGLHSINCDVDIYSGLKVFLSVPENEALKSNATFLNFSTINSLLLKCPPSLKFNIKTTTYALHSKILYIFLKINEIL